MGWNGTWPRALHEATGRPCVIGIRSFAAPARRCCGKWAGAQAFQKPVAVGQGPVPPFASGPWRPRVSGVSGGHRRPRGGPVPTWAACVPARAASSERSPSRASRAACVPTRAASSRRPRGPRRPPAAPRKRLPGRGHRSWSPAMMLRVMLLVAITAAPAVMYCNTININTIMNMNTC